MNIGHIILGIAVFVSSISLMGYTQSYYPECPQFGEVISKTVEPISDLNCIFFNLAEVLLIAGAFVGTIVGIIGLISRGKR